MRSTLRILFIFLIAFVSGAAPLLAQTQSTINWYFGNSGNALRFIRPDYNASAITIPNNLGQGMSAVATDPVSGEVLFYTDGVTVYDGNDNVMPNGTGLNGNSTISQGVAVSAVPGSPDEYYIFTNNGNISYSVVNMTLPGNSPGFPAFPLGEVTSTNQAIPGLAGPFDESMIVLPKTNRDGFWLLLHAPGSGLITVVDVNDGGFIINTSPVTGLPAAISNMAWSPARGLVSFAPQNAGDEVILAPFNITNGLFTTPVITIAGTDPSSQPYNIIDTEWSNSGRFFYISGNNGAGQDVLLQVDLDEPVQTLRTVTTQNMQRSLGLQLAPDSLIYHLYQHTNGTFRVGRINRTDTIASQVLYSGAAIGDRNYQARQFPVFLPPYDPMLVVDFTFAGTCANVPTTFLPEITPSPDSVVWNFGDGNGSANLAPFYTYEAGGTYNVTLTAWLNGELVSTTKPVNITQFDLQISGFPESDTVCFEDFPVEYTAEAGGGQGGGSTPTFRWSNLDTNGATTSIDSAGTYYVTATDQTTGCTAYQSIRVVEYGAIESRGFIWYFGEHAGIDFNPLADFNNPGPARPIPFGDPLDYNGGNQMTAPEGCAIYNDANGNPLFYSDGLEMYDREGNLISADIGGDELAAQSILIVEFPQDATLFYVFLTRQIYDPNNANAYELSYVIFDLKLNDGLGGLMEESNGNVAITNLYTPNTERLTGNQNWIITHEYGTKNFRSYPVRAMGIGAAVVSNVGSVHPSTSPTAGQGYMKLSNSGKLAVALSISSSENYVELFDFADSSGAVSNPLKLDINDNGQVYGVEFSPDGRILFASVRNPNGGGPSKIYRWQIDTTTVAGTITNPQFIRNSRDLVVNEVGEDFGALQLGPDGQIYVARNGSPVLAIISNPGADMVIVPQPDPGFQLDGFGLGPNLVDGGSTLSTLGLPNFLNQTITTPPSVTLSVFSGCVGDALNFSVLNPESLETYRWNILNSDSVVVASGLGEEFEFLPDTPGAYRARVDVIPECQIVQNPPSPVSSDFVVYALPELSIANVVNTSACQESNGSFDLTITGGLTDMFAYELSGPVAFVSDTIPPGTYSITDLPAGTYNVYAINTVTGCQNAISQVINDANVEFSISATTLPADCDNLNGTIEISIEPNDGSVVIGYPVSYTVRSQGSELVYTGTYDNADGLNTIIVNPVNSGTYNIEVTESTGTGCTVTTTDVTVNQAPFAFLDVPNEIIICDDSPARIPFATNAPGIELIGNIPGPFEIRDGFVLVEVPGTYIFQTVDPSGALCPNILSTDVIFTQPGALPADFALTYSICPEDPLEENRRAILDPGNNFLEIRYLDEEGGEITGTGPDYSLDGNILTVFRAGPVTIELTNPFGCVTQERINVLEDCKARFTAPDALRPGSDLQENQTWKIYPFLIDTEDFQVFIFNRWGEMIFQSTDLNFEWNGGYDNDASRPVPVGTYAYKVQFKASFDDGKGTQELRGRIVLIR